MWLNEQQRQVVSNTEGPVMVISCAGSGKTSVILERTNSIIQSGISSGNILVVTFSKAAAMEMKERFEQNYKEGNVKFSTIHSVCYSILAKAYSLSPLSILRVSEKKTFLREQYIKLKNEYGNSFSERYKDAEDFYKDIELKISGYMSSMYRMQLGYEDIVKDRYEREILGSYIKYKKVSGKIDYDDMIIECHKYLKISQEALEYWRGIFRYIMIDEYQDTTILQAEIFFMLAKERNICVVGDDDQSIYSFRDADSEIFKKFLAEYPDAKQIFLEINYRSKPQIIKVAENIICHNKQRFHKNFIAFRKGNAKITKGIVDDSIQQAKQVVGIIREYEKKNVPLNEVAVLYRIKNEATVICSQLLSEGIPFYTKELPEDIHRGMVYQDIKAYYRLANDLYGRTDLRRIINRPKRYIKAEAVSNCKMDKREIINSCTKNIYDGEKKERVQRTIETLFYDLSNLAGKTPTEFMQYLLVNMKYRECLIEYADFLKVDSSKFTIEFDILMEEAKKFNSMMEWDDYVKECENNLLSSMEENKKKGVYLSTFHSAKGLEWDNVIIISANEGVTPFIRESVIENEEEERRLFYVAVTRAKEELYIIHFKEDKGVIASRYLLEMNENYISK